MSARSGWAAAGARLLLLAVLLLAFCLRLARLGHQELRGDEAFGYFFIQQGYASILEQTVALDEPHPVASYFVQKPWLQVAGASEFALRYTSAWFSVLAVALLARVAARLGLARRTGTAAALLLAVSPYAVWHAQDARMYSMSLALNTATVWLAMEALARRRWPWIAAYVAAAWLALHTHYFSAFVLLALTLFVVGRAVFVPAARRSVIDWLGWNVVLLALYAPWLMQAGGTLTGYEGNGDSPAFFAMLQRSLSLFAVGESTPAQQRTLWAALAALLLAAGALRLWKRGPIGRRALWLLLCWLGVPVLLTWAGALERPIFNERYLVAALPAFLLLAASAVEPGPVRRRWMDVVGGALLFILAAGMAVSLYRHYADPLFSKTRGWRQLAATVVSLGAELPAGAVWYAQTYPDPALWYYTGPLPHGVLPPAAFDAEGAAREVASLSRQPVERVVLAVQPSLNFDNAGIAQAALQEHFDQAAMLPAGNWTVELWTAAPQQGEPRTDEFERSLRLVGASVQPQRPTPGGALAVYLDWLADPVELSGSEKASVQLLGPDGTVVAQADLPLDMPLDPETPARALYGILLPQALSPGEHRLIVAVYDPEAPGSPRLQAGGADSVELARWTLP